jgi:hypothetical protein
MSHDATNWAIQQRGLKPTTKIVLWHLCNRHNPDYGCFPSQNRLAYDSEISRSTLNDHLGHLEAEGLLRRVPRIDPATKRQMPTRYILGFEKGFAPRDPNPSPEFGHGFSLSTTPLIDLPNLHRHLPFLPGRVRKSDMETRRKPCPDFRQSRVRKKPKAVSGIRTLTL